MCHHYPIQMHLHTGRPAFALKFVLVLGVGAQNLVGP